MKKFFKALAVVAALAVASTGLVSCSNDDDDDTVVIDERVSVSTSTVKATYTGSFTDEDSAVPVSVTVYFYDDSKYKVDDSFVLGTVLYYETQFSGTYTGDPTTDGTITLTSYQKYEDGEKDGSEQTIARPLTVKDGKMKWWGEYSDVELTRQ